MVTYSISIKCSDKCFYHIVEPNLSKENPWESSLDHKEKTEQWLRVCVKVFRFQTSRTNKEPDGDVSQTSVHEDSLVSIKDERNKWVNRRGNKKLWAQLNEMPGMICSFCLIQIPIVLFIIRVSAGQTTQSWMKKLSEQRETCSSAEEENPSYCQIAESFHSNAQKRQKTRQKRGKIN